jgi:ligand-binding SRPBCC domain-containing protein
MEAGARIDYRLRLHGVPIRWRTLIESYEPPERFTDVQISGPYSHWRHTHVFLDAPGGTRMIDTVDYSLPLGPIGALARVIYVRRALERIFDYRRDRIRSIFA